MRARCSASCRPHAWSSHWRPGRRRRTSPSERDRVWVANGRRLAERTVRRPGGHRGCPARPGDQDRRRRRRCRTRAVPLESGRRTLVATRRRRLGRHTRLRRWSGSTQAPGRSARAHARCVRRGRCRRGRRLGRRRGRHGGPPGRADRAARSDASADVLGRGDRRRGDAVWVTSPGRAALAHRRRAARTVGAIDPIGASPTSRSARRACGCQPRPRHGHAGRPGDG